MRLFRNLLPRVTGTVTGLVIPSWLKWLAVWALLCALCVAIGFLLAIVL